MVAVRSYAIDAEPVREAAFELDVVCGQLEDHVDDDELLDVAAVVQAQIEALSDWLVGLHRSVAA